MENDLTVSNLRKELKAIGYKLKIKSHCSFKAGDIISPEGHKINNFFGSKEEAEAWREKHAKALEIKAKYKGNLFDGLSRVVL